MTTLDCQARLRGLGLALHSYHDARGSFPPALADDSHRYLSWMGRILPYVEQDAAALRIDAAYTASPWPWANPPHPTDRVVRAYTCPADARTAVPATPPSLLVYQGPGSITPVQLTVALTSYLGVSGTDLRSRDGVLYANSRVRLADITD